MTKSEQQDDRPAAEWPAAAQVYLSLWSMGIDPEGKQLRVTKAAALAGISRSAVQRYRETLCGFREAEEQARKAAAGYHQELARHVFYNLVTPAARRLAEELGRQGGDPRLAFDLLKIVAKFADAIEINAPGYTLDEIQQARAELEAEGIDNVGGVDTGTEQPPGP